MKTSLTSLALIAAVSVILASCSSAPSPTVAASRPASGASEVQVTVEGFAYHPADLTIPVGTKVMWTNKDGAPHTITSDDALWDSGQLNRGDTFEHTFGQAGTFKYHCSVHPSIRGTITVTP